MKKISFIPSKGEINPSLFEQVSSLVKEQNEKLLNDPNYINLLQAKNKQYYPTNEPAVAKCCDECQLYSSDGVEHAAKYFCDEECKENYYRGVDELMQADKYDQMRELGLESFYS